MSTLQEKQLDVIEYGIYKLNKYLDEELANPSTTIPRENRNFRQIIDEEPMYAISRDMANIKRGLNFDIPILEKMEDVFGYRDKVERLKNSIEKLDSKLKETTGYDMNEWITKIDKERTEAFLSMSAEDKLRNVGELSNEELYLAYTDDDARVVSKAIKLAFDRGTFCREYSGMKPEMLLDISDKVKDFNNSFPLENFGLAFPGSENYQWVVNGILRSPEFMTLPEEYKQKALALNEEVKNTSKYVYSYEDFEKMVQTYGMKEAAAKFFKYSPYICSEDCEKFLRSDSVTARKYIASHPDYLRNVSVECLREVASSEKNKNVKIDLASSLYTIVNRIYDVGRYTQPSTRMQQVSNCMDAMKTLSVYNDQEMRKIVQEYINYFYEDNEHRFNSSLGKMTPEYVMSHFSEEYRGRYIQYCESDPVIFSAISDNSAFVREKAVGMMMSQARKEAVIFNYVGNEFLSQFKEKLAIASKDFDCMVRAKVAMEMKDFLVYDFKYEKCDEPAKELLQSVALTAKELANDNDPSVSKFAKEAVEKFQEAGVLEKEERTFQPVRRNNELDR